MPTLSLHLLTQILFKLESQPSLATAQPFRHLLQVVGAHCRLGQLAQQSHYTTNRLLKLISPTQITAIQNLLNLPIEPKRGLVK